jgi:hypothetical protein
MPPPTLAPVQSKTATNDSNLAAAGDSRFTAGVFYLSPLRKKRSDDEVKRVWQSSET